jgi:hypothetical protein
MCATGVVNPTNERQQAEDEGDRRGDVLRRPPRTAELREQAEILLSSRRLPSP